MNKPRYAKKSVLKSRWWIWLIVVILAGGAAGFGIYAYNKSATTTPTPTPAKTIQNNQPDANKKELPKEGVVSDVKFQVKGVSASKTYGQNDLTKATASGTFKIIKNCYNKQWQKRY